MQKTEIRLKSLDQFFIAYILAALALASFILWGIVDDARNAIRSAEADTRAQVQTTSEDIALEIGAYRHDAQLMARERQALFEALLNANDPDDHLLELAELTAAWFPKALAFTVGNVQGEPIITDFKGSIGEACRADMKASATQNTQIIPLHGLSTILHFDINVPVRTAQGGKGVFLITFTTDNLVTLLSRHSDPRFSLELGMPDDHGGESSTASPGHPQPEFA
jgi:hypothetical protein